MITLKNILISLLIRLLLYLLKNKPMIDFFKKISYYENLFIFSIKANDIFQTYKKLSSVKINVSDNYGLGNYDVILYKNTKSNNYESIDFDKDIDHYNTDDILYVYNMNNIFNQYKHGLAELIKNIILPNSSLVTNAHLNNFKQIQSQIIELLTTNKLNNEIELFIKINNYIIDSFCNDKSIIIDSRSMGTILNNVGLNSLKK